MELQDLLNDCFKLICECLDDKSFVSLISCNKILNSKSKFKNMLNTYKLFLIMDIAYKYTFTRILYDHPTFYANKIPTTVTYIEFRNDYYYGFDINKIPPHVTYIKLG